MGWLSGKRVVVVGLGKSGISAAKLAIRLGAKVTVADHQAEQKIQNVANELRSLGATLALGDASTFFSGSPDLVVISPGVPSFPELEAAITNGVKVISEVELAVRSLAHPAPVVAIGGTNGKSTVTSLVAAIFEQAGKKTFAGGNLGEPLSDHETERFDVVVLEVSSFQMERLEQFQPRVSVLLNVTPDHLDRYPDFDAYVHAKGNSFERQTADDVAVVPVGDHTCLQQAERGKGKIVTFGPGGDVDVDDTHVIDRRTGTSYDRSTWKIQGGHNALNVAAAICAVTPFGISPDVIDRALRSFEGLGHRMAFVGEKGGVRFYDDSKGTNVGASVTALLGLAEERAVLIAGGKDKGGSYEPLVRALIERGRAAVLIGEAAPLLEKAIASRLPTETAKTMEEAVKKAFHAAKKGDAVLLSPACSSFDMFRDYKERGEVFVRAVKDLLSR